MDTKEKLEKVMYELSILVSKELIEAAYDVEEYMKDLYLTRLRGSILGELDDYNIKTAKYPIDWWEAVKERWFPRWLKKFSPVKYKVISLNAKIIYPTLKPRLRHEHKLILRKGEFYDDSGDSERN
jgi:hypothetical protein